MDTVLHDRIERLESALEDARGELDTERQRREMAEVAMQELATTLSMTRRRLAAFESLDNRGAR